MIKYMKKSVYKFLCKHSKKSKIATFLLLRPKLMFVDKETSSEIKWLWKCAFQGVYYRGGNENCLFLKNAHIAEKGLQSFEREAGRSKAIISYLSKIGGASISREQLVYRDKIVRSYNLLQKKEGGGLQDYSFNKAVPVFANNEIETIDKLIYTRRSIRWFSQNVPSATVLNKIFQTAVWAPNSCNRQTVRIFYTMNPEKVQACMSLNSGATAMNRAPVFISFVADMDSYILPTERHVPYIDVSLAAQNVVLRSHAEGFSTCVLNWSHASEEANSKLKKILGIRSDNIICFNMVLGAAMYDVEPPYKLGVNEFVKKVD
ncbi:nitroreductase family protein [Thiomicrorhabdus sediminis]|uniref:Nitroreductase family protein n=1 Tax=Thiomicrorhabdus sediminis TaxID=2580412 RepID=A0A4V1HHM5_9GAMM|nr:nitroreductase family protein [Thiomicrorhabdus sediminis]QCU89543.1 nitroreductase family protein [Thiomicrorhabdus sediminis]